MSQPLIKPQDAKSPMEGLQLGLESEGFYIYVDTETLATKLQFRMSNAIRETVIYPDTSGGFWICVHQHHRWGSFGVHIEIRSFDKRIELVMDEAFFWEMDAKLCLHDIQSSFNGYLSEMFKNEIHQTSPFRWILSIPPGSDNLTIIIDERKMTNHLKLTAWHIDERLSLTSTSQPYSSSDFAVARALLAGQITSYPTIHPSHSSSLSLSHLIEVYDHAQTSYMNRLIKRLIDFMAFENDHSFLFKVSIPLLMARVWSFHDEDHAMKCLVSVCETSGVNEFMIDLIVSMQAPSVDITRQRLQKLRELTHDPIMLRMIDIGEVKTIESQAEAITKLIELSSSAGELLRADLRLLRLMMDYELWDDVLGIALPMSETHRSDKEIENILKEACLKSGRTDNLNVLEKNNDIDRRERLAQVVSEFIEDPSRIVEEGFLLAEALEVADPLQLSIAIQDKITPKSAWESSRITALLGYLAKESQRHDDAVELFLEASKHRWRDILIEKYLRAQLLERKRYEDLIAIDINAMGHATAAYREEIVCELVSLSSLPDENCLNIIAEYIRLGQTWNHNVARHLKSQWLEARSKELEKILALIRTEDVSLSIVDIVDSENINEMISWTDSPFRLAIISEYLKENDSAFHLCKTIIDVCALEDPVRDAAISHVLQHKLDLEIDDASLYRILEFYPEAKVSHLLATYHKEAKIEDLLHARKVCHQLSDQDPRVIETIECLGQVRDLELSDLQNFKAYCDEQKDWVRFLKICRKQIALHRSDEIKLRLLIEIAEVSAIHRGDDASAIAAYTEYLEIADHVEVRKKLMEIYRSQGDTGNEKIQAHNLLRSAATDLDTIEEIVSRDPERSDEAIESILASRIQALRSQGHIETAAKIARVLLKFGSENQEFESLARYSRLMNGNLDSMCEELLSAAKKLKDTAELNSAFDDIKSVIRSLDIDIKFEDVISHLLAHQDLQRLHSNHVNAIRLYALRVFLQTETYLSEAIQLLNDIAFKDILGDAKLLIPVYVLLRDFDQFDKKHRFLRLALPIIKNDPKILDNTPFTLESLENEHKNSIQMDRSAIEEKVVKNPQMTEIDRHVFAQIDFFSKQDVSQLESSPWKIWRSMGQIGYPMFTDRELSLQIKSALPLLDSPLHQYLVVVSKALIRQFPQQFSLHHIAKIVGRSKQETLETSRCIAMDELVSQRSHLMLLASRLHKNGIKLRHTQGLSWKQIYDFERKELHLDTDVQSKLLPSVVFHLTSMTLNKLKLRIYPYFHLDLEAQIMNGLTEYESAVQNVGALEMAKRAMGMNHDPQTDQRVAEQQLRRQINGTIELPTVKLWMEQVEDYLLRKQFLDTLDLVGIVEAIEQRNLLDQPVPISELQPRSIRLIRFAKKWKS